MEEKRKWKRSAAVAPGLGNQRLIATFMDV